MSATRTILGRNRVKMLNHRMHRAPQVTQNMNDNRGRGVDDADRWETAAEPLRLGKNLAGGARGFNVVVCQ